MAHKRKKADPDNLSRNELEAFIDAYRSALDQMDALWTASDFNSHFMLLKEHAVAIVPKLVKLWNQNQVTYKITLTPVEAMAMYQFWQIEFDVNQLSANAINKVMGVIHRIHTNAARTTPARRLN